MRRGRLILIHSITRRSTAFRTKFRLHRRDHESFPIPFHKFDPSYGKMMIKEK